MPIDIYYINLDIQPERRARIEGQLAALGLEATRIKATTPNDVPAAIRAKYGNPRRLRPMTGGELACTSSHLEAMRRIADGPNRYGVVLEDDAVLSKRLPSFLSALDQSAIDLDLIKLDSHPDDMVRVLNGAAPVVGDVALRRVISSRSYATAYAISPEAARIILAVANIFSRPIDDMIFNPAVRLSRRLVIAHADPGLCAQSAHLGTPIDSTLVDDRDKLGAHAKAAGGIVNRILEGLERDVFFGTWKTIRQLTGGGATKRSIGLKLD